MSSLFAVQKHQLTPHIVGMSIGTPSSHNQRVPPRDGNAADAGWGGFKTMWGGLKWFLLKTNVVQGGLWVYVILCEFKLNFKTFYML